MASAYAARIARRAAEYGVVIGDDIGIDMRRAKARTDALVAASRNGLTPTVAFLIRGFNQMVRPEYLFVQNPCAPSFRLAVTTTIELP